MPVTIWIPAVLRRFTGGRDELPARGATVGEALAGLGEVPGQLLGRLVEHGELRPRLNVFVNGSDIRAAHGLRTPVRDGDEISIVPTIAGGR